MEKQNQLIPEERAFQEKGKTSAKAVSQVSAYHKKEWQWDVYGCGGGSNRDANMKWNIKLKGTEGGGLHKPV